MGYRPEDQSLADPINQILDGFDNFHKAARERIISGEWTSNHIDELNDLRGKFLELEAKLVRLKKGTW